VAEGHRAVADVSDVAAWDGAATLIERCVDEFGTIDGLVNNAGVIRVGRPEECTEDDYRSVVGVNLLGSCFCGTLALRRMLAQGHGAVVNVTSGSHAGTGRLGAYGATKGAIASLTYSWALDVAGRGVRVNAVAPLAQTRMWDPTLLPDPGAERPWRLPEPADNAPVVIYLLADASAPLNGQVVRIDSGRLSLMNHPAVLEPVVWREAWTVADVAAAFEAGLATDAPPLGLVTVRQELAVPFGGDG